MDKMKKIEHRLEKTYHLQKQLEKKRKKLVKLAAKTKQQSAQAAKKLASGKLPAVPTKDKKRRVFSWRLFVLSLGLSLVATVIAFSIDKMLTRAAVQRNAYDRNAEEGGDLSGAGLGTDYEQASLEELEEALLRVENQLDEVTAAIEKNKK